MRVLVLLFWVSLAALTRLGAAAAQTRISSSSLNGTSQAESVVHGKETSDAIRSFSSSLPLNTTASASTGNSHTGSISPPTSSSTAQQVGGLGGYIASGIGLASSSSADTSVVSLNTLATSQQSSTSSANDQSAADSASATAFAIAYQSGAGLYASNATGTPASILNSLTNPSAVEPKSTLLDGTSLKQQLKSPSSGYGVGDSGQTNTSGIFQSGVVTAPATSTTSSPWTVPAAGNGSSYYWACNDELSTYKTLLEYPSLDIEPNATTWATAYTASTTKLCDGHARIVGSLTVVSTFPTLGVVITSTYDGPAPTCQIPETACESMWSQYSTAYASFESAFSAYYSTYTLVPGAVNTFALGPTSPVCTLTGSAATGALCGPCTIIGGEVELLYFPVTTNASQNFCVSTLGPGTACPFGSTVTAITNSLGQATGAGCSYSSLNVASAVGSGAYIVSEGQTFYQNLAYISYKTAYATNTCGTVGSAHSGGFLPVSSFDVYSLSGYHYYIDDRAWRVNFADLTDTPWSAYAAMPNCDESGNLGLLNYPNKFVGVNETAQLCADPNYLIYEPNYRPYLAVPPQFRNIDPAWSTCILGLGGLNDPPKALQPASTAAGLTTPGGGSAATTPASPASTPNSPAVTTSAAPLTTPNAESDTVGTSSEAVAGSGGSKGTSAADNGSGNGGAKPSSTATSGNNGEGHSSSGSTGNDGSSGNNGGSDSTAGISGGSNNGGQTTTAADPGGAIVSAIQATSTSIGSSDGSGDSSSGTSSDPSSGSGSENDTGPNGTGSEGSGGSSSDPDGFSSGNVVIGSGASATTVAAGSGPNIDSGSAGSSSGSGSSVVSIGSSSFTVVHTQSVGSSAVVVANGGASVTLAAGATTTLGGQAISAASSGGVFIGTGTAAVTVSGTSPGSGGEAVATVGGQTISADPSDPSAVVIDGSTLAAGQATTISGTLVSIAAGGSVIIEASNGQVTDTIVIAKSSPTVLGVLTIGDRTLTVEQLPGGGKTVVVDGSSAVTLNANTAAMLAGVTLSAGSSGESSFIVVDGLSTVGHSRPVSRSQAVITLGGQTITATEGLGGSNAVDVAGTTLTQGQVAAISGTIVSLGPSGLVVGGTRTAAFSAIQTQAGGSTAMLTLSGHTVTAVEPAGESYVIVDGKTISNGQAATIDGVLVSDADGMLVAGSETVSLTPVATASAAEAVVTIDGHTYTAVEPAGASYIIIDGKTVSPGGPAITIDSAVVSDASGLLKVGMQTYTLSTSQPYSTSTPTPASSSSLSAAAATSTTRSAADRWRVSAAVLLFSSLVALIATW